MKDEEIDEDDGIEIFDEPVAMPPSIGFGNTLETLQKLGLFNKNGNEVWVLLQQLESLHVCNSLNSRTVYFEHSLSFIHYLHFAAPLGVQHSGCGLYVICLLRNI